MAAIPNSPQLRKVSPNDLVYRNWAERTAYKSHSQETGGTGLICSR
jgi:hypothetical protein